jgi:hypothetical protein
MNPLPIAPIFLPERRRRGAAFLFLLAIVFVFLLFMWERSQDFRI